jgi:DNA-binding IclR family transcriptional regulator
MVVDNTDRRRRTPYRVKRPGERRSISRSATRALDVLEQFGQLRRPLRAVEISKLLELQPSTTDQLLKTMVDSAHLVFDVASKSYLPSPRLVEFGLWLADGYGGDARLRRLLRDLELEPGEVATLSTPNDLYMQILDLVASGSTGPRPERGLRAAMFGSAIGAAYLSTLPDAELARLAERGRIPAGEVPQLLRDAARARSAGFADGPSPDEETWSLAVPLPTQGFGAPMVLGIAGRPERIREGREAVHASMQAAIERWMRPR